MKKIALLILLIAASDACAQYRRVKGLAESLKQIFDVRLDRMIETADLINIWKLGLGYELADVAGVYNPLLETLALNRGMTRRTGAVDFVALTLPEMTASKPYPVVLDNVMTLYHEMAHAEYDMVVTQPRANAEDKDLVKTCREVKAWCVANIKDQDPEKVMREWHGYVVESVVSSTIGDWKTILEFNGLTHDLKVDMGKVRLYIKQIPADKYDQLVMDPIPPVFSDGMKRNYGDRSKSAVLVVGFLMTRVPTHDWPSRGFKSEWHEMAWKHFRDHQGWPFDTAELFKRMTKAYAGSAALAALKAAREQAASGK